MSWYRGVWWGCALVALSMAVTLLLGCAGAADTEPVAEPADAEAQQAEPATPEVTEEAQGEAPAEQEAAPDVWTRECTDRRGDLTAYAVTELTGAELQALLQQQGYVWSTRNQLWTNEEGSAAVVVLGPEGQTLPDEQIGQLSAGGEEAGASYRLVSGSYTNAQRAFEELVGDVMTCEDVVFADQSGVAVATGPSGRRVLVLVGMDDGAACVSVFGEGAVEAGLLDAVAGHELGATLPEAYEALAGHSLAEADEASGA